MVQGKHHELHFLETDKGGLKALPSPSVGNSLPFQELYWQKTTFFNSSFQVRDLNFCPGMKRIQLDLI